MKANKEQIEKIFEDKPTGFGAICEANAREVKIKYESHNADVVGKFIERDGILVGYLNFKGLRTGGLENPKEDVKKVIDDMLSKLGID